MEGGIVTEHPLSQETGKFSSPAARAELKSTTSLPDAGMVDCWVRRVGEAGSNGGSRTCLHVNGGSQTCLHVTRYCTHYSSFRIRFGPYSIVLPFGIFSIGHDVVCRPDPDQVVHISGVHQ